MFIDHLRTGLLEDGKNWRGKAKGKAERTIQSSLYACMKIK
jgi:hypothetical protein